MIKESDDVLLKRVWDYMVIETPLAHADVILVGDCNDIGVAIYAAELYNTGFAPRIVFSGYQQPGMEKTEADNFADIARDYGVPESAILRETAAVNTGQNITFSQQLLKDHDIIPKTVMLVHKPYMSRRFLATAEAQWVGPMPHFIVRHEPTNYDNYVLKNGRGEVIRKLLGDFGRMRTYAKKGFQSPQPIPDDVQSAYDTLIHRGHHTR